MHVLPLNITAVTDKPTLGAFLGVRLGNETLGVSPELAFYRDPSALDLRTSNYLFVPSFTFHGDELLRLLF